MTLVTRQNLMAEKTRFFISVGGVALAVFLISFLLSLFQGWNLNVGRFVENVDADLWVAREGTTDFLNAASLLTDDAGTVVQDVPGVQEVDPIVVRPMDVYIDGKKQTLHLVGYEQGRAGGPESIKKGEEYPSEGSIIIDSGFARKAGVGVGDEVTAIGQPLRVSGISGGGDFVFSQVTFVSLDEARALLGMQGLATFYLVHVDSGADPEQVAVAIDDAVPGVRAYTSEEFANATRDRIMKNLIPILFIVLLLAFIVGVAITGLTIYNATVEKAREFGILKAIGFTNGYLFLLVAEQSLITGLLGFIIGASLTVIAAQFVSDLVPQFVTLLRWQDIAFVFGATILMSVAAALLPVRRITSVDPVMVFNR